MQRHEIDPIVSIAAIGMAAVALGLLVAERARPGLGGALVRAAHARIRGAAAAPPTPPPRRKRVRNVAERKP